MAGSRENLEHGILRWKRGRFQARIENGTGPGDFSPRPDAKALSV